MSGDIRFVWSYPFASFGHVQYFEPTPPDKYVQWVNVTHALVCGLSSVTSAELLIVYGMKDLFTNLKAAGVSGDVLR